MLKNLTYPLKDSILNRRLLPCIICVVLLLLNSLSLLAQMPVATTRPRIFLDPATKAALLAKKANNDPDWQSVLADANKYLPHQVIAWNEETASASEYYGTGDIFYSYCGSSWEEAAIKLGMAHQLTKTNNAGANATAYSNKLLQLADVIIKAYKDYPPNINYQPNIFQFNSSYATRHVGKTIGIIYDWCYNELGATRKAELLHVMKDWFTFMSAVPYRLNQLQDNPTGNYFMGHLICAGYMGYAIGNDDPLSQKMIDFARQRMLGTPGSLNTDTQNSAETAHAYFTQAIKGGLVSSASESYLGPSTILAAPQKDGLPVQGWSYGGETTNFIIDYCYLVKSATGEDMLQTDPFIKQFFTKTSVALVHSYMPNRFQYDNSNDNGSFLGCTSSYALPLRLSAILEGTPEGGNIEYFYKNLLQTPNLLSGNTGYHAESWEKLLYGKTRIATPFTYKPFYPAPDASIYSAIPVNTGLNKFYLRNNWTAASTWAAVEMGTATYDQHNHNNAGHFKIVRGDAHDGDDHLLVASNEVAKAGGNGVDGPTNYSFGNSFSNTLFLNDFTDYDPAYPDYATMVGGQSSAGYDEPTHQEQNDNFSYFRSDLTTAYLVGYYNPDTTQRSLTYYYRSFLYLRNSDVFVVYDKLLAKNSANASGQYKKHLRWHFLNQPAISGNNITATMDNSKLFIHTVLPAALNIAAVDESSNPDNTFGSDYNYYFNTNTWRTEVSVAGNPLKQDIVTVLQPGAKTATEMVTTALKSNQNNMEGSIMTVNGNTELVLFNTSTTKYLAPVSMTSYTYTGPSNAQHTLCGMNPGKNYQIAYAASTVTVTESPSGTVTASPSGVLSFKLPGTGGTNATLANLTISSGTLSPAFASGTISYTASVTSATTALTLTPTAADPNAKIKVNGVAVTSGTASGTLPLAVGINTITTVITADDGIATKTYTLKVTRPVSTNAYLTTIKLSPSTGITASATGPGQENFISTVPNNIASISIIAITQHSNATITVNNISAASGVASAPVALQTGANVITVIITAEDGITKRTYVVTVTRLASANAYLSAINLSTGAPLTALATGPGQENYSATVSTTVSGIGIIATTQDSHATITVNGVSATSGVVSSPVSLVNGINNISVVITAEDGTTKRTYGIVVKRQASSNPYLATIKLSPATAISPSATGPGQENFVSTVLNNIASISIVATVQESHATITVNGISATSGVASTPVALQTGANVINVVVTAEDGITKRNYAVLVTRLLSANAYLTTIKLSPGTALATSATGPGQENFTTTVPNNISAISVIATAQHSQATITVNGISAGSGVISTPAILQTGSNVITVIVTAEDGTTKRKYAIIVTRLPSANAYLSAINLSPGAALTASATGPGQENFTGTVSNNVAAISVVATTQESHATITVNGISASSGVASSAVTLTNGINTIIVTITAEDGATKRTYAIIITRLASANAYLSTIKLTPGAGLASSATGPGQENFTGTVANGITAISVIATTQESHATITVNGISTTSGVTSSPFTLVTGPNTIMVNITAEDGTHTRSYAIIVTRQPPAGFTSAANGAGTLSLTTGKSAESTDKKVIASNIISPNGDGKNDTWVIKNIELYPDNVINIFDSMGKTVLNQRGYANDWDGSYHGSLLPEGTYNYIINLGAGLPVVRGFITIVRSR